MKKYFISLSIAALLAIPTLGHADGVPENPAPVKRYRAPRASRVQAPPPPTCVSKSTSPKVKLLSWDPHQKIAKFLGVLHECSTTQWEVLKLLSGPNTIGLDYPEEKEMWGYLWLWTYKLQNPIEETVIIMDKQGKRIVKGKNPVELYLTFNKDDILEKVSMVLVKKKNSNYLVMP